MELRRIDIIMALNYSLLLGLWLECSYWHSIMNRQYTNTALTPFSPFYSRRFLRSQISFTIFSKCLQILLCMITYVWVVTVSLFEYAPNTIRRPTTMHTIIIKFIESISIPIFI